MPPFQPDYAVVVDGSLAPAAITGTNYLIVGHRDILYQSRLLDDSIPVRTYYSAVNPSITGCCGVALVRSPHRLDPHVREQHDHR
jgi:hypothetical protein